MVKGLAITLLTVGLSLLGVAAYQLADRERHQAVELRELQTALRAGHSAEGGTGRAFGARMRAFQGSAWGRLEMARVGLSAAVDEGVDGPTLRHAVGHLPGTAFPGEAGNVVLAGHRDGLFRPLRLVKRGDRLQIRTLDGSFDYVVKETMIVRPERTDVLTPAPDPQVTLVTCYPFYYVGAAPLRFVVKATAVAAARAHVARAAADRTTTSPPERARSLR